MLRKIAPDRERVPVVFISINDPCRVRHICGDATIAPHWEHTTMYLSNDDLQMTGEWA